MGPALRLTLSRVGVRSEAAGGSAIPPSRDGFTSRAATRGNSRRSEPARVEATGKVALRLPGGMPQGLPGANFGLSSAAGCRYKRGMKNRASTSLLLALALPAAPVLGAAAGPLALHPDNPHYFLFRGQPAVLVTSGEHYGAVLNRDFDYVKYVDALAKDGLNLTRTFVGSYVEPSGAFNIAQNTLAPATGRFICPWARSDTPGYANGGNKFDLTKWDDAYFARLKDFVKQAGKRGVVVEVNLFCPFYEETQWKLSPQNAANNVNGIGTVARTNVYTLDRHGGLLAVHEALARKLVTELNAFDNVYYEICNEPYFGGVTLEWQHHIADVIAAKEKSLANQHLISRNVANGSAKIDHPHPAISIFNFHYAYPPDAVGMNFALNKVIGDNETGFRGTNDLPYRAEAWHFMLAGGGLYNNLDYSFTVGHEDGTFVYPAKQPGGGNPAFRRQIGALKRFIESFDFLRMQPLPNAPTPAPGFNTRVLVEPGRACAVYVSRSLDDKKPPAAPADQTVVVALDLPAGTYQVEWLNPVTGVKTKRPKIKHGGGYLRLDSPSFRDDVALKAVRTGK